LIKPLEGILDLRATAVNFPLSFFYFSLNHRQADRTQKHGFTMQLGPLGFIAGSLADIIMHFIKQFLLLLDFSVQPADSAVDIVPLFRAVFEPTNKILFFGEFLNLQGNLKKT
jgi:hypothetical protein